jgi:hypothetical protein
MVRKKIALYSSTVLLLAGLSACGGGGDIDARTITRTTELPASFNCPQGEIRSRTGIDVNQNGLLETDEVASDIISCKVENGLGGNDGFSGDDKPA